MTTNHREEVEETPDEYVFAGSPLVASPAKAESQAQRRAAIRSNNDR
jgi:hypothetical protein